jgi:tripartite-type tricarboxylate transporter receptor subunit TctC
MKPSIRALCATVLLAAAGGALAQAWPARQPIRIVVPYAPAGYYDLIARVVAPRLQEALGQTVLVDNRAGANGSVGTEATAKAPPDGYTIMIGGIGPHAVNPNLYPKLGYDPVRDFAPIVPVSVQPSILVVHPSLGVSSVRELVALAKAKPGQISYASAGAGSSPQLATEMFNTAMGVKLIHIPYKGSGPAAVAMMSGETQVYIGAGSETLQHIRSGRLQAIAVADDRRLAILPDVPTMQEAGVPNYRAASWFGFFAPAGTPREIVARLNTEINKILKMPAEHDKIAAGGTAVVTGGTPEQLGAQLKSEIAKWAKVIKDAGVTLE